jgi:hypothetical protein
MAEGRLRHAWDQTALLWVALAEPNRDPKQRSKPFTIFDVHPYRTKSESQKFLPPVSAAKRYFT